MITRDDFKKAIGAVRNDIDFMDRMSDTSDGSIFLFDRMLCVDQTVNLLEKIMDDKAEWIEYWIYELEFGKKWEPFMITEDGRDVRLETEDDLYDLLISDKERRDGNGSSV